MNKVAQKRAKKRCLAMVNERHDLIMEILKEKKTANVKALAKTLFVSEATVRRDLAEMQTMGLIKRSHGGAILPDNAQEVSIFVRMNENAREKEKSASSAILRLPDFQSVFIDSSSSALALAERIDLRFKTVVTNNLQTAILLSKKRDINLILLGGSVQYNTISATGAWTARQLGDFSFDLMISSCAAITGTEVLERSIEQKEIKLSALARSKKRVLIVDHTKFSAQGTYRLASLADYDLIATDAPPPEELLSLNLPFAF